MTLGDFNIVQRPQHSGSAIANDRPRVSSCSQLLAAEARHLGQVSKGEMLRGSMVPRARKMDSSLLTMLTELLYNPLAAWITLDLGTCLGL